MIRPAETCWSSAANENTSIRLTVEDIVENQVRFMNQFVFIKDCQSRADDAQRFFICHLGIVAALPLIRAILSSSHSLNCFSFVRPDKPLYIVGDRWLGMKSGTRTNVRKKKKNVLGPKVPIVCRQRIKSEYVSNKCQWREYYVVWMRHLFCDISDSKYEIWNSRNCVFSCVFSPVRQRLWDNCAFLRDKTLLWFDVLLLS